VRGCGGLAAQALQRFRHQVRERLLAPSIIFSSFLYLSFRRHVVDGSLDAVVAPFTEFRYVHSTESHGDEATGVAPDPTNIDNTNRRAINARQAILSMAWSWPGVLYLADPNKHSSPPLSALVNILYLSNLRIRVSGEQFSW
jgi:hypothetical protein